MEGFFKLKQNGTTVAREVVAGLTTFVTMVYIIFVNRNILGFAGMPTGAVYLATIIATVIGTLVMGLFANVPYALAPGMGLNAFFAFTVCGAMGFTWQQGLSLVFLCGIINIIITVTKVRKMLIKAIPASLQHAIGGGIGLFIAYIGLKDGKLLTFTEGDFIPGLATFNAIAPILAIAGLIIMIVLLLKKVKGAIIFGIVAVTLISVVYSIYTGNFSFTSLEPINEQFSQLKMTFGQAFTALPSLFTDTAKLPLVLVAIFAFSLSDTFDTIGTFIGTGRKSGIFTDEDLTAVENNHGFKTKMEKALFADSIATSIGAIFGTSNTTTYVESSAGIEAGGRTGLTSVVTAILFALCIVLYPLAGLVPAEATAGALIVVGIMMASSFKEINWHDFGEAVPAFMAVAVMTLAYNISIGIAFGFIFYVIVKLCQGKLKEVHPILLGSSVLFLLYFVVMAII